jgi:hypothetical protein
MAALQFALQGAEYVGSGLVHGAASVAEGVGMMTHDPNSVHKYSEMSSEERERCDQLAYQVPGVIEMRKAAAGGPEYRELRLDGTGDDAQWMPVIQQDAAVGGWHPAVNFLQMNFDPPMTGVIRADSGSTFLAYAPSDSQSPAEQDQLVSLTMNFGEPIGTFTWNGRVYQFEVTIALPCYPASSPQTAASK